MASDMQKRDADLALLQEKWAFWFNWLDINGDGRLTAEDWAMGAETMIQGHGLDEKSADVARASYHRIGALLLGKDSTEDVGKDDFVRNLTEFYEEDRLKAEKYIFNVIRQLFLVADVNRDALISENEFAILMKSFGIKSEGANKFFHQLKQSEKGKVSMQDAINWWVNVWFGTDADQWGMVKEISE